MVHWFKVNPNKHKDFLKLPRTTRRSRFNLESIKITFMSFQLQILSKCLWCWTFNTWKNVRFLNPVNMWQEKSSPSDVKTVQVLKSHVPVLVSDVFNLFSIKAALRHSFWPLGGALQQVVNTIIANKCYHVVTDTEQHGCKKIWVAILLHFVPEKQNNNLLSIAKGNSCQSYDLGSVCGPCDGLVVCPGWTTSIASRDRLVYKLWTHWGCLISKSSVKFKTPHLNKYSNFEITMSVRLTVCGFNTWCWCKFEKQRVDFSWVGTLLETWRDVSSCG